MPYVNVRILDDGVTPDQKHRVIAGITEVLVTELGKDRGGCTVVIDEVPLDNWGLGGESVTVRRKRSVG